MGVPQHTYALSGSTVPAITPLVIRFKRFPHGHPELLISGPLNTRTVVLLRGTAPHAISVAFEKHGHAQVTQSVTTPRSNLVTLQHVSSGLIGVSHAIYT